MNKTRLQKMKTGILNKQFFILTLIGLMVFSLIGCQPETQNTVDSNNNERTEETANTANANDSETINKADNAEEDKTITENSDKDETDKPDDAGNVSDTLLQGQELKINQELRSKNGMYKAIMQPDGNFCLYEIESGNKKKFIKCTMTVEGEKKGNVLKMQKDGNLVLYNNDNTPLWATDTQKYRGSAGTGVKLVMENDGKLVIYNQAGEPIYDFNKGTGKETQCEGCPK